MQTLREERWRATLTGRSYFAITGSGACVSDAKGGALFSREIPNDDVYGEYNQAIEDRTDPADRLRYYLMTTSNGKLDTSWREYEISGNSQDFANWRLDGNEWIITDEDAKRIWH
jgi:hypothetical protein